MTNQQLYTSLMQQAEQCNSRREARAIINKATRLRETINFYDSINCYATSEQDCTTTDQPGAGSF